MVDVYSAIMAAQLGDIMLLFVNVIFTCCLVFIVTDLPF